MSVRSPTTRGCRGAPRKTVCSMTTQSLPISTRPPSEVSTAPYKTAVLFPIETSPLTTAVGATYTLGGILGRIPLTVRIIALQDTNAS